MKNLDNEEKQINGRSNFSDFDQFLREAERVGCKDRLFIQFSAQFFCWPLGVDKRPLAETEICHYQGRIVYSSTYIIMIKW